MLSVDSVVEAARAAKANGATRFCMGAAWRSPKQRDLEPVLAMVRQVRALGLETCATLGMLKPGQAGQLREENEQVRETLHYLVSPATLAINNRVRTERRGRSRTTPRPRPP